MLLLSPAFLLLLPLAALPWFWPAGARDVRRALLRSLILALVVLAMARPVGLRGSDAQHHVLILDRSASTQASADLERSAREWRKGLPDSARVTRLAFGAPHSDESSRELHLGQDSPLGLALERGLAEIPGDARGALTVVSDGLATRADWGPAVTALQARGVPVHSVRLISRAGDLRPVRLEPLDPPREGRTLRVAVDLLGAAAPCTATVALLDGEGQELARAEPLELEAQGRARVVLTIEPAQAGFLDVTAVVEASAGGDAHPGNERISATLAVQDPLRVLYLGGRMRGGKQRLAGLVGSGFEWTEPADDARQPTDYDLVVVDDRPASALPAESQRVLIQAVAEHGTGLVMSGGSAAFGPGGYHEEPIEQMLPVSFVQKEEKRDPSTTLVVIIDTSGSMGGNRVQLAKEVARLSIRRLLPHDKVGIVEFYGAKRWAAPIQPASNSIELERALNRLDAGGGTVILPAIEEAFYGMQNVQTRYKHVLVLTDGGVETGDFEGLMRRMADKGINVSTVLVGPDAHSEFLVNMANWGKGRFYSVPNRFNLPEVLLKQPASAKLPAYRPGTAPVEARGGPGWWGEVDPSAVPALEGYVETRAREGAERLIETSQGRHPVLTSWRYGLGRVTALCTEPTGPGTENWRDWDGYGPFLARVLARTAADGTDPFHFTLQRSGRRVTLIAERRVRSELQPEAWRLGDAQDGGDQALSFVELAPGRFEAGLAVEPLETLLLLAAAQGDTRRVRLVSDPRVLRSAETQVDPARALDLAQLSRTSGGSILSSLADIPQAGLAVGGGERPRDLREWAPLLLLLALLTYLLDLFDRRRPDRDELTA